MHPDDRPINRRKFFRHGLRELLKPLAAGLDNIERVTHELGKLEGVQPRPTSKSPARWLRPPGAIDESAFTQTCSRCGTCVSVCPAHCIRIHPAIARGAPYIDVAQNPCVVCDGAPCMRDCPSGALLPIPIIDINMGTAIWDLPACLRTRGEACQICVDLCPIGSMAIEVQNNRIVVHESGCVGCGVCEHHCPTTPKSVTIMPKAYR
jgi:MauM/NapG family ferredoxin protein